MKVSLTEVGIMKLLNPARRQSDKNTGFCSSCAREQTREAGFHISNVLTFIQSEILFHCDGACYMWAEEKRVCGLKSKLSATGRKGDWINF